MHTIYNVVSAQDISKVITSLVTLNLLVGLRQGKHINQEESPTGPPVVYLPQPAMKNGALLLVNVWRIHGSNPFNKIYSYDKVWRVIFLSHTADNLVIPNLIIEMNVINV